MKRNGNGKFVEQDPAFKYERFDEKHGSKITFQPSHRRAAAWYDDNGFAPSPSEMMRAIFSTFAQFDYRSTIDPKDYYSLICAELETLGVTNLPPYNPQIGSAIRDIISEGTRYEGRSDIYSRRERLPLDALAEDPVWLEMNKDRITPFLADHLDKTPDELRGVGGGVRLEKRVYSLIFSNREGVLP
ncbi:hypothetical protein J4401_02380 [Candidatus Woesearchaeota archaeon]|nr:hypothetical protein [Candidatus Woesearchaeota archaeon]